MLIGTLYSIKICFSVLLDGQTKNDHLLPQTYFLYRKLCLQANR